MEVSEGRSNSVGRNVPEVSDALPEKVMVKTDTTGAMVIEHEQVGLELFETVVKLSGLPKPLMRLELDQILENSGQTSEFLTLDQLRQALIIHLEALHAEMIGDEGGSS